MFHPEQINGAAGLQHPRDSQGHSGANPSSFIWSSRTAPFGEFHGVWVLRQQLCRPWAQLSLPGEQPPSLLDKY